MAKKAEKSLYDKDDLQEIASMLIKSKSTLSVAESVTSGCLQTAFSSAEGATLFFQGGITVYQGGQKTRLLDVEPIYGKENEFVNFSVACQMALSSNKLFLSSYAIAITGFTQQIPDHEFKNPYAYYAIAKDQEIVLKGFLEAAKDDSLSIQENYTWQILKLFKNLLRGN
jgi:nicotinamide-nucleotide amidase